MPGSGSPPGAVTCISWLSIVPFLPHRSSWCLQSSLSTGSVSLLLSTRSSTDQSLFLCHYRPVHKSVLPTQELERQGLQLSAACKWSLVFNSSWPAVPGAWSPALSTSVSSVESFLHPTPTPLPPPCSWQPPTELHPRRLRAVRPAHVRGWLLGNKSRLSVNHMSKERHKSCSSLAHINSHCHEHCRHESLGLCTDFGPVAAEPSSSGEGVLEETVLANPCLQTSG